jgi:hypothetical protein
MSNKKQWRSVLHEATLGRCFYCAVHVSIEREPLPRDWLRLRGSHRMVIEHATSKRRGGADHLSNYVPSCERCNQEKGKLTFEEFMFIKGLRLSDLSFTFHQVKRKPQRDWLCCHSPTFEPGLLTANFGVHV